MKIGFLLASVCLMTTTLPAVAARIPPPAGNVLLARWSGPYGGVPPFDRVRVADFKAALPAAMEEQIVQVTRIACEPRAATFANTIAALERSGRSLDRISRLYSIYVSTMNDEEMASIEQEMAPLLAGHDDEIIQNERLFQRIEAVYQAREHSGLNSEQQRLAWVVRTEFVQAGAQLDAKAKIRLKELNQQLATLYTTFSQNLLAEENGRWLALEGEADFAGLPDSVRAATAAAAAARAIKAPGVILNTRSSVEPFLGYSSRRDLRERVWRTFVSRGDNGDAHDNNAAIVQILRLRAERAHLLGYATHAHWRLANTMAKSPEHALGLMEAVWPAAVARVHEEVADMQAIADRESIAGHTPRITIEPWDYRYYAEKVRKEKFDLDANEVKPYLQLEQLREGMFWVAGQLFGLHFAPVAAGSVSVPHPDVRVFEVTGRDGKLVGLWYFDPYARQTKRSGAWMNAYRRQERFDHPVTTIVSNNSNFVKGEGDAPVLISWEDATTLFHEFGHALHGLSSDVSYPTLSGTAVARDYVEFPSQLLEHWLSTPELLNRYAHHFQTGRPMPPELVAKIHRSTTFNQGFKTVEYLSSALIDMQLHLAGDGPIDPRAFEREALAKLGMPRELVMRHRTPQFGHIFSSDSYSAGYYSYLWAETLSADAWEAFVEAGGPYDPVIAKRLHDEVFRIGNTRDPEAAYRSFRGRDPGTTALLRTRGFPLPAGAR